ncbi:MAG: response regulator [Bacteroidota bacterium]
MSKPQADKNPAKTKKARVIFVIEDNLLQQELLSDYIKSRYKVDVHSFSNGDDALNKLDLNPDLVFLDYNLELGGGTIPTGVQVLKQIKSRNPNTPVVMLTLQDQLSICIDCMKHGAYDYIVKGENAFKRMENVFGHIDNLLATISRSNVLQKRYNRIFGLLITLVVLLIFGLLSGYLVLKF